jgi:hypothetical protein
VAGSPSGRGHRAAVVAEERDLEWGTTAGRAPKRVSDGLAIDGR